MPDEDKLKGWLLTKEDRERLNRMMAEWDAFKAALNITVNAETGRVENPKARKGRRRLP